MSTAFDVTVGADRAVAVITLRGDITIAAREDLDAAYAEAVGADPQVLVLSFDDVDYINSTGIALLVGLLARARSEHRSVRAFGLTEHYREIFAITRLSDFIELHDNEAGAVTAGAGARP